MSCARTGCGGTILDDGYCDTCWLAPPDPAFAASVRPSSDGWELPPPAGTPELLTQGSTTKLGPTLRPATASTERHRLGGGLVELPKVHVVDPSLVVLTNPEVPEHRRSCSNCHEPVGRTRNGVPGRTNGFCAKCGTPFGFDPKLAPGDLVGGQYEVAGCLAHGGLGWVYLAVDRKVADQWVVLKGMLDSGDRDAKAAALAELRFLAEVEHPNIVKIYNFVEHDDAGYIVMEFVKGPSLRDLLHRRRETNGGLADPLPAEEAGAYVLEVLPAIGHLHDRRLLFCDFKPDNLIRTEQSVKLIDLGGVYRMDDDTSPIYGTVGFQAPEIARSGPTIASDLFTVGRTLAVLCTDFPSYHREHRFTLPDAAHVPLYTEFDSLYRLLERATAADPDERFQTADQMATQLLGVLREIVSVRTGAPSPGPSTLFAVRGRVPTDAPVGRALPRLVVDPDDPGAGTILALGNLEPGEVLYSLAAHEPTSPEIELWQVRTLVDLGELDEAERRLSVIESSDPWTWRARWYRGLIALERRSDAEAMRQFDTVYRTLPGELAPKIALGFAHEVAGRLDVASEWYRIVARTDPAYTVASFGLARCRAALGDRDGAVDALDAVPDTSNAHLDASVTSVDLLVSPSRDDVVLAAVHRAASIVDRAGVGADDLDGLRAPVLAAALRLVCADADAIDPGVTLFGVPCTEQQLRLALEASFRAMARYASSRAERIELVDRANSIRPRSIV